MARPVQRGGGWYVAPMFSGKRYANTFQTEEAAEDWVREASRAHKQGKPIPDPNGATKSAAKLTAVGELAGYCYKMRWGKLPSGPSLYQIAQCFVDFVGSQTHVKDALTTLKIGEYVADRMSKGASGSTINRHLSAISVIAKTAHSLDLIAKMPLLPWQKEGQHRMRWFTVEEEGQILARLASWGQSEFIDLFVFLCDTGARFGEAKKLTWEDIRGKQITFENTKNKDLRKVKSRTVVATPRVVQALERRRVLTGGVGGPFHFAKSHLVRTTWNHLRTHLAWMGEDTVIHTFRHTCASRLVQAGVDIYRVKNWMGHTDINTTMRYAKLAPSSMDDLGDVLAGLGPKALPSNEAHI